MATTTTNFGWDIPQSTDLVKDGATAIAALGQDIDTALVDLKGGTTGQVLAKASGTDLDFSWVAQDDSNAIQNAIVDAKGDLIAATAADTPARLAVGTNGTVLTADSAATTGLKWAAVSAGKVLQVVSATYSTQLATTSASYVDTGLTATITPTSATSTILVLVNNPVYTQRNGDDNYFGAQIVRGATAIQVNNDFGGISVNGATNIHYMAQGTMIIVDNPATTSATTYKMQGRRASAGTTAHFQYNNQKATITLLEIGA
jgi:hypothetical protein